MRLEQFQYIIEVNKNRSITKAAKHLYIAQPSLSAAISNLEQELNTKIFNRTPEGVEATEMGRYIIEKASRILQEVEEINNACLNSSPILKGTVTISTLPAISNYILLEAFSVFKENYPQVNIIIKEDDSLGVIREMKYGGIDLGIIALFGYEKISYTTKARDFNIWYEELFTDELCLFVSTDHVLANKQQIQTRDFQDFPLVIFKNNFSDYEIENAINYKHPNIIRFTDRESIKKIIARGTAVGFLPRVTSFNDIYVASGKIVPLSITDMETTLHIGILYRKDYLLTAQKKFISTLKSVINVSHSRCCNC
ncbi:LysR family transcriptional regulator [Desulfotomaculum defluvii]